MVATRRRITRGKSEKYEIGDKVEVVRVGGVEIGILLSKDEEEDVRSGDVAHWVVSVDGSSEEEIVSQKMLGRVLETQDQSDGSTFEKSLEKPAKKSTKVKAKVGKKKLKTGVNTRAGASKSGEALLTEEVGDMDRRPAPRPKKKDGDETVIEVKMLTGTLFIYRGENHRVEFIRTV